MEKERFKSKELNEIYSVMQGDYLQLNYIDNVGNSRLVEGLYLGQRLSNEERENLKEKGIETYSLRHSDSDLDIAEIDINVRVNHFGDFITKEKVYLNDDYTEVLNENWNKDYSLKKENEVKKEPEKKAKYNKEFTKEEKEEYKKKQNEEKAELLKTISDKIDTLRDSEEYKKYLLVSSKFNNYSINNIMLIISQKPNASLVASYTTWKKDFDRYVKKGEKAIKIIAPAKVIEKVIDPITKEEKEESKLYFHTANVFDISQTDGKELPEVNNLFKADPTERDISDIYEGVKHLNNIPVYEAEKEKDVILKTGALGYYNPKDDSITIRKELNNTEKLSTLVHEMAHSVLHKNKKCDKRFKEVQAESVAFVVLNHFEIKNAETSSLSYISSYSKANKEELKESISLIHSTSNEFITKIEKHINKSKEIEKSKDKIKVTVKEEEYEK